MDENDDNYGRGAWNSVEAGKEKPKLSKNELKFFFCFISFL